MTPRVFVSSRAATRTGVLLDAIRAADMVPITAYEVTTGESVGQSLRDAIAKVDYVIVVWDTQKLARSVMFEAGYALGVGTPVALLDVRTSRGPVDDASIEALLNVPRLHAKLFDFAGLRRELLALRQLSFGGSLPTGDDESLSRWYHEPPPRSDSSSEARVLDLFRRTEIAVNAERVSALAVPDWVVWAPSFAPPFNPVLVELVGLKGSLERKREQLRRALDDQGALIGVLIALDHVESRVEIVRSAAIVQISLRQLEQQPADLLGLLRHARNSLVHGRS